MFAVTPTDVMKEIFSYFPLSTLGASSQVSKAWNGLAMTSIFWQKAVYREIATNSRHWAKWDAELVKDVDLENEYLSLPENIAEELRKAHAAFPGKITETHMFVKMPQGLTLRKLGLIAKRFFPNNEEGYRYIWPEIMDKFGDQLADECWLLMTNVIDGTRGKSYKVQKKMIADIAQKNLIAYKVPTILQAATCVLAEYFRSGERRLGNNPLTYTHCQGKIEIGRVVVGGFASTGLYVLTNGCNCGRIGVAALRKF